MAKNSTNKLQYLNEGDKIYVKGSAKEPYEIKKVGGVVSCTCMGWKTAGGPIETRGLACKHLRNNVDPGCLGAAALTGKNATTKEKPAVKYTKTGKVSTAVGGVTVKDTAPPCLLAHVWDGEKDVSGWLASWKLDGCRSWWNGKGDFITRLGNIYHAPEWFKTQMPWGIVLDGELFAGNGKFQETISTVRKLEPIDSEWKKIKFMVFDMPEHTGTYEERLAALNALTFVNGDHIEVLKTEQIKDNQDVYKKLKEAESQGYEGIMLREPGSKYVDGRSNTLLKVKSFKDAEARVIDYIPGRGKHKGRLGALVVEMPESGKTFQLGSGFSDKERESPPKIGSIVTYRYQELSSKEKIPRFPSFIAERSYE